MSIRKIHIWPDPVLSAVSQPVKQVDAEIRTMVRDLFDTMYDANGVGLAANQIGITQRVLVIDLDPHGESAEDAELRDELARWGFAQPMAFINPEIVSSSGEVMWQEGCLSVPGVTESVRRHEQVVVRALDVEGKEFTVEAAGLFAVALQHEIDHLEGRVFVEYLSKLKRDVIKRKMNRLKVEAIEEGAEAALL